MLGKSRCRTGGGASLSELVDLQCQGDSADRPEFPSETDFVNATSHLVRWIKLARLWRNRPGDDTALARMALILISRNQPTSGEPPLLAAKRAITASFVFARASDDNVFVPFAVPPLLTSGLSRPAFSLPPMRTCPRHCGGSPAECRVDAGLCRTSIRSPAGHR